LPDLKKKLTPIADWWHKDPFAVILISLCTVVSVPLGIIGILAAYCKLPYLPTCASPFTPQISPDAPRVLPFNKTTLFVSSSINSDAARELSDKLIGRLNDSGLPIASNKTDAVLNLEISRLTVGPPESNNATRVTWTVTVNAHVIIRQVNNNRELLAKDFAETTNPAKGSPENAEPAALLQLADRIMEYLNSNRKILNLQSHAME
jgi:Lipopolysaccharide-assembly